MHESFEFCGKPSKVSLMKPGDFNEINQWCIDEGWNLGLYDSDTYYKIDPKGHFILKNDEAIASLSLIIINFITSPAANYYLQTC